jgi:hypothetical protein
MFKIFILEVHESIQAYTPRIFLGTQTSEEIIIADYFVDSFLAPTMVASCHILNINLWFNLFHCYELKTRLNN